MSNRKKLEAEPDGGIMIGDYLDEMNQQNKQVRKEPGTTNSTSKIDFIQEILNSHRLESKHKEKLLTLASSELKKLESEHDGVRSDVNVIKRKLREISDRIGVREDDKKISASAIKNSEKQQKGNSKTVHNPQKLVNLLSKFRKDGSALKYAVHKWDVGTDFKDFESFLKKLKADYGKISKELKSLSSTLNAKCYQFLLNPDVSKKGWGYDRIPVGWSSPELTSWCRKNTKKNPLDLPLEIIESSKNIHFSSFKDVVDHFKKEIEIRSEGDQLKKLVIEELKKQGLLSPNSEFNRPELINLESKTFYTDVQWLRFCLSIIFESIKKEGDEREECKDIVIEAIENDEYVLLKLVHKNSFSEGASININNKLTSIDGDFWTIKKRLMNLCDWSIENKFKEGDFRLNYLCSDSDISFKEEINSCEGFTHLLKFYKSNL